MLAAGLLLGMITNLGWAGEINDLRGRVYNRGNDPVPGCIIYLTFQSAKLGPAITNSDGAFELDIPTLPPNIDAFLEVVFGHNTVFRKPIPAEIVAKLQAGSQQVDLPSIFLSDANKNSPWH